MKGCIFCQAIAGERPAKKVWEDEKVLVIEDIHPQAPVHLLILPKKHIATLLEVGEEDQDLLGSIVLTAKRLAEIHGVSQRGFRLVANCLAEAGQSVFHLHFHFLAGRPMRWPPG